MRHFHRRAIHRLVAPNRSDHRHGIQPPMHQLQLSWNAHRLRDEAQAHRHPPTSRPARPMTTATAALSTTAPDLSPAQVSALVRRLYGIDGTIQPLAGERDQNCRVETADGSRYVFKISNPSEPVEVIEFQIAALDHIARASPDQPVPRI